jgi:hypothetical protein
MPRPLGRSSTLAPPLFPQFFLIFAFGQCPRGWRTASILTFDPNRYLHCRLRREDPASAAAIRLAPCSLWAQFLQYRDLVRQATSPGDAMQTDEDEEALQVAQTQILHALQLLDLPTAQYLIIPQHDEQ